ncbi:MAG: hypothetical protein Q9183_005430 [Haloplaca sp. 2 TL-2023]
MQTAPNRPRQVHIPRLPASFLEVEFHLDMQGSDFFRVAQLPHVQVVAADDAREVLDIGLDIVDGDARRDGLEEDAGSGLAEGDSGGEDDDSDDEGDAGVDVVAPGPGGEPDDEGGADDADVAQGVAHDVEEDAAHVEVAV